MFGDDMCPFNLKCTFKVFINVKCGSSFEKIPVLRRCQKDIDLIKVILFSCGQIMLCLITWYLYSYLGEGNGNPLQYSCLENPMGGA